MSTPVCRACGSTRLHLKGRKPGSFIRRKFDFLVCQDCGLMFVEPFSGFEIYNDAYYRGEGPDPYVNYAAEYHDWTRSDRVLEFDDLVRLADERPKEQTTKRPQDQAAPARPKGPLVPSSLGPLVPGAAPLRWLDFGCGAGAFLKYLRTLGSIHDRPLEITGHDVGSYATLLQTKDGFRILDLDELRREPDASFDVISMIEVLEHLPSPLEPLQLVSRLLKPGGRLLLTTGNLDSPIARRQGINYRYCAPEIHVSLFDPGSLARIYRRAGLEPEFVRYHGAVQFKVLKSLRHRRTLRALARLALCFPPVVRLIDHLYGVSAMPCAVKPNSPA